MATKKTKLRVIPLGGLGEIGKNITCFEFSDEIIIVDCGVAFPEDEMLGIDLVIPDFTYLVKNKEKVKAVFLTHGHEDHIGSIPYFLREINVPIYGSKLTLGLLENKIKEHRLNADLRVVPTGGTVTCGRFKVEFVSVTHSIADASALAITTPVGLIVHSGDFKVDYTPIKGESIDLQRFAELGKKGVLLFLCESTNVEERGNTMSEKSVGQIFEQIFQDSKNQRIMVATFSSNIHRIQQIVNSAVRHKRKVVVMGRSMANAVRTARELGYLDISEDVLIEPFEIKNYTPKQLVIIMTGSQGEPMSALSRIAASDHRQIDICPGDKIIISASPIPGNEKTVSKVINELLKKGAEVIYKGLMEVHVSGHAKQEEIKLLHALVKPKYFVPVHGEYRHLKKHRDLAVDLGMKKEDIFLMSTGDVLEVNGQGAKLSGTVPFGHVFVDGLGVGDVGNVVLRDRKHLAEDGLLIVVVTIERETGEIVAGPDVISRGFVYIRESDDMMERARAVVNKALQKYQSKRIGDWGVLKNAIKDTLKEYVWQKTKRSPMILPIIMEV